MTSYRTYSKTCHVCNKIFIAKTMTTKYCSTRCANVVNKERLRLIKLNEIKKEEEETKKQKVKSDLKEKAQNYLTVEEAAIFMRVSRRTIFRLIKQLKLKKMKVLSRTLIREIDIQKFFNQF